MNADPLEGVSTKALGVSAGLFFEVDCAIRKGRPPDFIERRANELTSQLTVGVMLTAGEDQTWFEYLRDTVIDIARDARERGMQLWSTTDSERSSSK